MKLLNSTAEHRSTHTEQQRMAEKVSSYFLSHLSCFTPFPLQSLCISREHDQELWFIPGSHGRTKEDPGVHMECESALEGGTYLHCPKGLVSLSAHSRQGKITFPFLFSARGTVKEMVLGGAKQLEFQALGVNPPHSHICDHIPCFPPVSVLSPPGSRLWGQGQGAGAAAHQQGRGPVSRERLQRQFPGSSQESPSPAAPGQEAQRAHEPEEEQEEGQGEVKELNSLF